MGISEHPDRFSFDFSERSVGATVGTGETLHLHGDRADDEAPQIDEGRVLNAMTALAGKHLSREKLTDLITGTILAFEVDPKLAPRFTDAEIALAATRLIDDLPYGLPPSKVRRDFGPELQQDSKNGLRNRRISRHLMAGALMLGAAHFGSNAAVDYLSQPAAAPTPSPLAYDSPVYHLGKGQQDFLADTKITLTPDSRAAVNQILSSLPTR